MSAPLRHRRWAALATTAVSTLCACGSPLPQPTFGDGDHTGEEPQLVLSMPPPGNVEIVPPRPKEFKRPVWIDGEWQWTGRRWVWKDHGWQDAPPDQFYEAPVTRRLVDGRLVHFPGLWKKNEPAKP